MYFIGRHYHALEQKGRLAIPHEYRRQLGTKAILTHGLDGCLFLFSQDHWHSLMEETARLPLTQKRSREWVRLLTNNASLVNFDSQGRILIPEHLISFAQLTKDVVIVGSLNRLEIWDRDYYHHYMEKLSQRADEVAESLTITNTDAKI
jgi:MraZ protein